MSDAWKAALLRFGAALVALAVAVAIVTYVSDTNLKLLGAGLAAAAVLGLEEWLKTSGGIG